MSAPVLASHHVIRDGEVYLHPRRRAFPWKQANGQPQPWVDDSARNIIPMPRPTTEQLLKHAAMMSDAHLRLDLDTVLDACPNDDARSTVRAYYRLRRTAPGYRPRDFKTNSHGKIGDAALRALVAPAPDEVARGRDVSCVVCSTLFRASRRDARYCSGACRVAATRTRACNGSEQESAPVGSLAGEPQNRVSRPHDSNDSEALSVTESDSHPLPEVSA